jgi:hypothetical protein
VVAGTGGVLYSSLSSLSLFSLFLARAGLAHELAHDWIEEARKRLVVEQAISVISADVTTLKPPTDL